MKRSTLGVIVLAVVLFFLNPGMDDFTAHFKDDTAERIEEETGGGVLGRVLGGAGSELAAAGVERTTTRSSYLVASTYDVDPDGDGVSEYRYLGVGGTFITLREPE